MNKSRKILCWLLVMLGLFLCNDLIAEAIVTGETVIQRTITDNNGKTGTYYLVMAYEDGEKEAKSHIFELNKRTDPVLRDNDELPADQLFIELGRGNSTAWVTQTIRVQGSKDGNNYKTIKDVDIPNINRSYPYCFGPYSVDEDIKYIRIVDQAGTLTKYHRNVYLTMKSFIEPEKSDYNFGTNIYQVATEQDIKINWSNINISDKEKDEKDITIGGADADQFEIINGMDNLGSSEGKCGYAMVKVRYKRTRIANIDNPHTAILKVNDSLIVLTGTTQKATPVFECPDYSKINSQTPIGKSVLSGGSVTDPTTGEKITGTWQWERPEELADCKHNPYRAIFVFDEAYKPYYNEINCDLDIEVNKIPQAITWDIEGYDESNVPFALDGDMTFGATAGVGVNVWYSSSKEDVAVMEGSTIHWLKSTVEVKITAHADADCNYKEAEQITKTFILNMTIPDGVVVSATGLDYGQTLSESTLTGKVSVNGEEIAGEWSWVYPNLMPEVGTAEQLAMFNPDDPSYATITKEVYVTVNKLEPTIELLASNVWRSGSTYTKPFRTNNQETGWKSVKFINTADVSWDETTQSIIVKNTVAEGTYQVTVCQNETEHYEAKCETFDITLRNRGKVCVPIMQGAGYELNSDVYDDMFISSHDKVKWCDVRDNGLLFDRYRGIEFGDYSNGGLNYDTKDIVLFFTGVPDKISFSTDVSSVGATSNRPTENLFWTIDESSDGVGWQKVAYAYKRTTSIEASLSPDTRYIKINYYGNFAGYILADGFKITRRHGFEVYEGDANDENKDENLWKPLTEYFLPAFGDGDRPLQAPQSLPIRYYSIGECGQTANESNEITISSATDKDYFYANTEASELVKILRNVDFDQWGETSITIRNTGINANGSVLLEGSNGDQLTINVSAAEPAITADKTNDHLFLTGTEQSRQISDSPYRGLEEYDFSLCFGSDNQPLFDSLYIFGVTGNTEEVQDKFDYFDPYQMMWLPKLNTPNKTTACNAHTPLFVYKKDGNDYTWARTIDNVSAEGLQEMQAGSRKNLAFLGYCPYAYNGYGRDHEGFIHFTSDGTNDGTNETYITLFNTEIGARPHTEDGTTAEEGYETQVRVLKEGDNGITGSGAIFSFSNTSKDEPYNVTFHIYGNNTLRSTRGANINGTFGDSKPFTLRQSSAPIMVNASSSNEQVNLIFDDLYNETHIIESSLTLISAEDIGVIDLGNEKSTLTIEGGIFNMVNGGKELSPLAVSYQRTLLESEGRYAILYGPGEDQTDAKVFIKDGTIVGDNPYNETDQNANIRMPWNTVITGGTFWNDIECYQVLGGEFGRPINDNGMEVKWHNEGMTESAVREKEPEYGMNSVVTDDDGKLFPMLPDEEQKEREDQINIWVAAMPDALTEVADNNINLLYMETVDDLFTSQSGNQYQTINRKENYTVNGTLSMLMQIDRADRWRTFVAPFDIKRVYVLGLAVEDDLDYDTKEGREELISRHKAAAEDFQSYLQSYIMPQTGSATLLPFGALLSKYVSENKIEDALYLLEHYDGTNFRTANYDLYQLPQPEEWMVRDDAFQAQWNYVKAESNGSIMKRGSTYILNFGYCPTCKDEYHDNHYDYWTGKFILFEGTIAENENYELWGTDKVLYNIVTASGEASEEKAAVFSGNASFGEVTLTNDVQAPVYIFNPISDFYEKPSSVLPLRPTESVLMYSSSVAPVLRISRNGEIIYGDIQGGTTTDIDYNYEKSECSECSDFETVRAIKVIEDGKVYILQGGHKYTLTGQLVY